MPDTSTLPKFGPSQELLSTSLPTAKPPDPPYKFTWWERLEKESISKSAFIAVINAPARKVEVADRLFLLPARAHDRCSPARLAVGTTRADKSARRMRQQASEAHHPIDTPLFADSM